MGVFSTPIEIGDPRGTRFEQVDALVDTGATFTMLRVPSCVVLVWNPRNAALLNWPTAPFKSSTLPRLGSE